VNKLSRFWQELKGRNVVRRNTVYAALGKKQEAVTEINKALYLLPIEKDAMYGTAPLFESNLVYLFNGDTEKAFDQLEHLLSFSNPYTLKWLDWYLPLQVLKTHSRYSELKKMYDTAD
jgi:hypothetical protein